VSTLAIDYGFSTTIDLPYDEAIEKVTAALKEEGFGILSRIDMDQALKQKLGVDFRRYAILGACNPPLAHQALSADLAIGLLLPCNVIVYEGDDEGRSGVAILNPIKMMSLAGNPDLEAVAGDAEARLKRVIEAL
jgi:uncharacterized protein (DUF302 family)